MTGPLRIGTIFSGIGAAEHAIARIGIPHHLVFASDCDKRCRAQYEANFKPAEWHDDVRKMSGSTDSIDLLVGGPPCQSFSMAGKRRGLDDERGMLVFEFVRIIKETNPAMFIFENVPGLVTMNSGTLLSRLLAMFNSLKYSVFWKAIDSNDHGIPQHRKRVFIVGFKSRGGIRLPFQFPRAFEHGREIRDYLDLKVDKKYLLSKKGVIFVTNPERQRKKYTQVDGKIAICQRSSQQTTWHGDFVSVIQPGGPGSEVHLKPRGVSDVAETGNRRKMIRRLTPRECLRLMGFDDTYKIVVPDVHAYHQSGNSIVVNVLESLVKEMIKYDGSFDGKD